MKHILINFIIFTIIACGSHSSDSAKPDEGWQVNRTIPYPNQVSEKMLTKIKNVGQPDLAATRLKTFATEQAWVEFIDEKNIHSSAHSKQLAERLNVAVKERTIADVGVFYLTPSTVDPSHKNRIFIHLHVGGYVFGAGYAGLSEALQIAYYTKIPTISIDYRMPPRHPFPAAVDDVLTVYKEIIKTHDPKAIAMGGTSAGGGLAMASIHNFKAKGLSLPGALFLGSPWTDLSKIGDSYFINEGIDRILVGYEGLLEGAANLYAGKNGMKNPLLSPIYGDCSGFPPTYLVSGTRDLFLSNTVRAHRKLKVAGVIAALNVYEGISHAAYMFEFGSPENAQVYRELAEFLGKHLE